MLSPLHPAKKSLRRKPPPPLEDPPAPQPPIATYSPMATPSQLPHLDIQYPSQEDSFDWNEDSLLSFESPKPMGPKELTLEHEYSYYADQDSELQHTLGSYDDYSATSQHSSNIDLLLLLPLMTSSSNPHPPSPQSTQPTPNSASEPHFLPKRKSFPSRKFQNLLHKSSSLFVPTTDANDSSSLELHRDLTQDHQHLNPSTNLPPRPSKDALLATSKSDFTSSSPPYPTTDLVDWETPEKDSPQHYDHRDPTMGTPNRIPSLVDNNLTIDSDAYNETFYYSPRSSPRDIYNNDSSALRRSRTTLSLPSSSPSRSPQRHRSFAPSSYISASSRSPSPQKSAPNISPFASDGLPKFQASYPIDLVFDDDVSSPEERIPKWNLLDRDPFEQDEYFQPYTPSTTKFDYSILPELPTPAHDDLAPLPLPPVSKPFQPKSKDLRLSIKKKNDILPPVPLDLPQLPFSSSFLNNQHFMECLCVWSMKSLYSWCLKLNTWLHDSAIPKAELKKALTKLLVFHKRNLPLTVIGRNAAQLIDSLIVQEAIEKVEEDSDDIRFRQHALVSGVLVELTDCYCHSLDHHEEEFDSMLNCYSSQCHINKAIQHSKMMSQASIGDMVLGNDWASHWQLTAEDLTFEPAMIKRQSFLFDLIKFEQKFIQRAECFVRVVGPGFIKAAMAMAGGAIMSFSSFRNDVLESAKEMLEVHRKCLMEPLLRLLLSEGILIIDVVSVAKLYLEWSKCARAPLLRYMGVVPTIEDVLQNKMLKKWDEQLGTNATVKELKVNGTILLLSTFNSRYQQLPLQLSDIRKTFALNDPEFYELTKAIDAIKNLGSKVNSMKVHADNVHALRRIEKQLFWKPSIHQPSINFQSEKRKFFYRGNLTKKGDLKINNHTVHVIVLDNYLLITERSKNQKATTYRVCEQPIPIDFLILENREREMGTLATMATPILANQPGNNRNSADNDTNDFTYPFKIRHAGRGKGLNYTFYATSESDKQGWFNGILQARSNLLRKVEPVAPFNVLPVETAFFAYDFSDRCTKLPVCCDEDPLQIMSQDTSTLLSQRGIHEDIYSANCPKDALTMGRVQCCEVFTFKAIRFYLVGLSSGIYCSDLRNRWKRVQNSANVTKITVLPHLNVVIVLANKALKYYALPRLVDIYYERQETITSTLLSNDQILFYEVGRHRGVPTLFLAKKKTAGVTSFKVFAIETDNSGIMSTFALLKRFYIQSECFGISIFNTSFAVHTTRGFEILDLQRLMPHTVPEFPSSDHSGKKFDGYNRKANVQGSEAIRRAISHSASKPMGMYKLNNNKEFLLVYSECALFVNKSGRLSRSSFLRMDFRPKTLSFHDNSLFIVGDEVVEVWSISDHSNGSNKLHQVVVGKDMAMLNQEKGYFAAANPRHMGLQMVFHMDPRVLRIENRCNH